MAVGGAALAKEERDLLQDLKRSEKASRDTEQACSKYKAFIQSSLLSAATRLPNEAWQHEPIALSANDAPTLYEVQLSESLYTQLVKSIKDAKQAVDKEAKLAQVSVEKARIAVSALTRKRQAEAASQALQAKKRPRAEKGPFKAAGNPNIAPAGRQVAAKDSRGNWILATVMRYHQGRAKYEVEDADPGDDDNPNPARKKFFVAANKVIMLNDMEASQGLDYAKNTAVVAMFPETSSFYPAVVVYGPKKKRGGEQYYGLVFQDDTDDRGEVPTREVLAQYVVSDPKKKMDIAKD